MTIDGRALDAWITREPSAGPVNESEPLHCGRCGGFLRAKPDRSEEWAETEHCDGSETLIDQEWAPEVIPIIGEQYRGTTYKQRVSTCGLDVGPHAPHDEVLASGVNHFRVCRRCGYENVEVDI